MKNLMVVALSVCVALGAVADGWKLGRYTTRVGDIVTVDIPKGKVDSGAATCAYDFPKFDGKSFRATVKARGFGVFCPETPYFGFKFMATYKNSETGENVYPGAPQIGGDFPWRTVTFIDSRTGGRRLPGIFTLGLQAGYGRVEFDLSTFKVEALPPLWPETNATHRCVYTPRVKDAPARRGVMLGHNLKEDDFKVLHDWGVTLARFQMTRQWNTVGGNRDLADYGRYIDGELDSLEKHLVWAKKYGIQIVVDLHAAPGSRDERKDLYMCHDAKYADAFIATWRKIATRFRGRPEIYGFDLINEPQQVTPALPGCDYWSIQSRAAEAIRAIDPETPVIIESNCYDGPGTFSYLRPLALTNIIYQVHMYVPMEFTHQGVFDKNAARTHYPDAARGWNIDFIRRTMKPVIDFQKRHDAKVYVGEFSAIVWGEGAGDYIRDCIDVFEENHWDWTFHAFREWSGWSVEYEAAEPWKQKPSQDNPRKRALLDGFRRGTARTKDPIRGPFPLLCTPWTAEGALDCDVLAKEAAFMSAGGVAGVIWPTAGEVKDLVREGEYVKGLDALAARAAKPDFKARLTAICPGSTSEDALNRVREVNATMAKHGVKMAILARPPDDAKTQDDIEKHYRALAKIAKCPVIIQTYNGKSPQPDVSLLVKLAKEYPDIYGYVKEESPGGKVNGRIAELVAAKPVMKTVFSGWGAKGWLYQGRALGTEGIVTQRPAYADLLAKMWAEEQKDDPDGKLTDLYSKYLLMINLGDTFGGTADQMRGPHLYVLVKRGVFTNTYTRKRPPKGDTSGKKWVVEAFKLTDAEKAEVDRRLAYCGLLP